MSMILQDLKHIEDLGFQKDKKLSQKAQGSVYFFNKKPSSAFLKKLGVLDWQMEELSSSAISKISLDDGPIWILQAQNYCTEHKSAFAIARDLVGEWQRSINLNSESYFHFQFVGVKNEDIEGALVGIQLGRYEFLKIRQENGYAGPRLKLKKDKGSISASLFAKSEAWAFGQNMARHLSNLPANIVNPDSFAKAMSKFFAAKKTVQIQVWDVNRLKKEKMGLLLGVGQASVTGSRLVHIRIRRAGSQKPKAFVGKGVCFDSGGLDIKPSAGMRWMKKDMSGAAVMAGLAAYVVKSAAKVNADFYLALSENAINENAVRPGDVLTARNGMTVEIHNTDAEGRLCMADALDVAVTQTGKNKPECVIDASTLTGAMRVALGLDVCGYTSNDDQLAKKLEKAGERSGELVWRLPLIQKYFAMMKSQFADFTNCGATGFGGAITAALFLEKFVGDTKWAHFDMMAWNQEASGALCEGGNGQSFSVLAEFLAGPKS